MTFFRTTVIAARSGSRAALAGTRSAQAPFSTHSRLFAGSSYGDGKGDPKGENPQEQGAQKSSDLEHPGPPPPAAGKGTGGGPTKAGDKGHHGEGVNEGSGSDASASKGEGSPKIHSPPNANEKATDHEAVKKHNEDFENRHDRSSNQAQDKEKVDSKFWSGMGGADRAP